MKIVEINTCEFGSTGKIMLQIAETARAYGHEVYTYSRKWFGTVNFENHAFFGIAIENALHHILGATTGYSECFSYIGTKKLINEIEKIQPDIIHIHNLHGWYINVPYLFKYIKEKNVRVIWTLHDCWAFTGHCPYFEESGCKKWKTGCEHCPSFRSYPKTYVDKSKQLWRLKREWFAGVKDMLFVTPSRWLAGLVTESFLKEYPVQVINNGIDLEIFKPRSSDFNIKHHTENKAIVLGVTFGWEKRKGLDVFVKLAEELDDSYQIVLVGTDDNVDKHLPNNIISIHRTNDQTELAEIYSAATVLLNPTREDNYPTVNMEAIACGTPVITFRTGGSPESVPITCGSVVDVDDIDAVKKEILRISKNNKVFRDQCLQYRTNFDKGSKFEEYVALYKGN